MAHENGLLFGAEEEALVNETGGELEYFIATCVSMRDNY